MGQHHDFEVLIDYRTFDAAFHESLPQGNLYDLLQQANQGKEHEYALHYFGKRLTYGWLFSEIERCTSALLALRIKRGEVVTVSVDRKSVV